MKSSQKAVRTVALMMAATVLSKLLGMVRGVLFAGPYGTGDAAVAFSAASRIPLSFFDMLFSAAILGCFIPVYNSFGREREKEADEYACVFFNAILLLTGVLSLLGLIFARQVIAVIAPNLDAGVAALAASLLRIMFPMIIFTGGAYTLVGVMQSKGSFILPAMISTISNVGVVIYLLAFNGRLGEYGIYGLAAAYLLGWLLQLVTLVVPLLRRGFRFRAVFRFRSPAFVRTMKMAPPIMIGSWLAPVGMLSGTFFASFLAVSGAVSVFDYSYNIYIIIVGTLTYSICNFVFPSLSRLSAEGEAGKFNDTVRRGITVTLFIIVPFMLAVLILAGEGVSVLYQRGEFGPESAANTARAVRCLVLAMPAFAVIELGSRVFYAKSLVKIPMLAAICGVAANVLFSAVLIQFPALGVGSVALANAAGQCAAALLLLIFLGKKLSGTLDRALAVSVLKIAVCGLLSGGGMLLVYRLLGNRPFEAGMLRNLLTCLLTFAVGAGIYLAAAALLRLRLRPQEEKEEIELENKQ